MFSYDSSLPNPSMLAHLQIQWYFFNSWVQHIALASLFRARRSCQQLTSTNVLSWNLQVCPAWSVAHHWNCRLSRLGVDNDRGREIRAFCVHESAANVERNGWEPGWRWMKVWQYDQTGWFERCIEMLLARNDEMLLVAVVPNRGNCHVICGWPLVQASVQSWAKLDDAPWKIWSSRSWEMFITLTHGLVVIALGHQWHQICDITSYQYRNYTIFPSMTWGGQHQRSHERSKLPTVQAIPQLGHWQCSASVCPRGWVA